MLMSPQRPHVRCVSRTLGVFVLVLTSSSTHSTKLFVHYLRTLVSSDAKVRNWGVAHTGVIDLKNELIPVRVSTSVNSELPKMVDGKTTRPAPGEATLTVTVTGIKPGNSCCSSKKLS
jgi:hypothetical protein